MRGIAKEFFGKVFAKCGRAALIVLALLWVLLVVLTLIGSFCGIPKLVIVGFYGQDVLRLGIAAIIALSPILLFFHKKIAKHMNIKIAATVAAFFMVAAYGVDISSITPSNKNMEFFEEVNKAMAVSATCWEYDKRECVDYSFPNFLEPNVFEVGQTFKVGSAIFKIKSISIRKKVVQRQDNLWRTDITEEDCGMEAVEDSVPKANEDKARRVRLSSKYCFSIN